MGLLSGRLGLTRYQADEYYAQALDAYEKGNLEGALENIGYALALLPQNSEYLAAQGLFHLEQDDEDAAREDFEGALAIHDGEALANYGMGALAYHDSAWDDAVVFFNKARAINPTQVEIPYYLALIYHRQQDNRTAQTYMEQALQLMEDAGDKRRTDARRWVREFEKLVKQQAKIEDEIPVQSALPLEGNKTQISVSRAELEAARVGGVLSAGDDDEADEDEVDEDEVDEVDEDENELELELELENEDDENTLDDEA